MQSSLIKNTEIVNDILKIYAQFYWCHYFKVARHMEEQMQKKQHKPAAMVVKYLNQNASISAAEIYNLGQLLIIFNDSTIYTFRILFLKQEDTNCTFPKVLWEFPLLG